jgi:hypothetical protein
MEFGKLTAVFDADTKRFDSSLKASEDRIKSLRQNIESIKADDIGFKSQRIAGLKDLLSKAIADHKALQKAQKDVGQETSKLGSAFKALQRASSELDSPLGGLTSRISSLTGLCGELSTSAGIVGVAIGAIIAVSVGAAAAIYELTTSVAESTGKFIDLSQQTGFSVETLSALSNAAETSGGSIETVANSLNIFQANMVAAREKGSEMSKLFKILKIDTEDNEKALRQALVAISGLTRAEDQAAVGKKILGRGFKELNAAVKEAGSLDAYMAEQLRKGTLITTDAAKRGDMLSDSVIEMGRAFESARRIVADEFGPDVLRIVKAVTKTIEDNRAGVKAWADEFKLAADGLQPLVASIKVLDNALRNLIGIPVVDFLGGIIRYGSGIGLIFTGLQAIGGATRGPAMSPQAHSDLNNIVNMGRPPSQQYKTLGGFTAGTKPFSFPTTGGAGGGGGAKGEDPAKLAEKIAQLQLEATVSGLKAEQDANKRALDLRRQDFNTYARQYMEIETRRHNAVIKGLDAEQQAAEKLKKGRDVTLLEIQNKRTAENTTHEQNRNRVLDERGQILDKIDKFVRDQEREIQGATSATDQWDKAYQDFVDTLKDEGVELEANTKRRIQSNITMLKEIDLVKQQIRVRQVLLSTRSRFETRAGRERPSWIDLGGGSTVGGEPATTGRPRVATAEEQGLRDRLEQIRQRMKELSGELTDVFSRSISDGFNNGVRSGLQTLAQGLLQIVEEIFLKRLAQGLENILTGLASGGGGGGFFSKILNIGGSALIGGIGGGGISSGGLGSAFAGAFASGGTIPMGQYGIVHDNERVYATPSGAHVIPAMGGKGGPQVENHYHYTINLPPDSRQSYSSPRSKRQLSEKLIAALQASQT